MLRDLSPPPTPLASFPRDGKTLLPRRLDVCSSMGVSGLEAVFLASRDALLRFLRAHGAGDAAEDLLNELWLRLREAPPRPVAKPLAYLYRAANNLMLDRYRSESSAAARERGWAEVTGATHPGQSDAPSGDREIIARQQLAQVQAALAALGPRVEQLFWRHRVDGVPQRQLAEEFGVSISTIESDLRKATRALIDVRRKLDQGWIDSIPSEKQR
jgi:RNA polymerase sigma factor (sigma-70 family)